VQVADNLRRIRDERGISTSRLSQLLEDVGRPIQPTGITKIEKGERKVDTDDLVALAVVLRVNPSALLLPPIADRTNTEVTAAGSVPTWKVWKWADGREPLKDPFDEDDLADFQLNARPKGKRRYHRPGERTGDQLAARRAEVAEIAARLYPTSVVDQNALIEREALLDPEAWAGGL
jgi:transcriptional regulator with XRE-family HTH domain